MKKNIALLSGFMTLLILAFIITPLLSREIITLTMIGGDPVQRCVKVTLYSDRFMLIDRKSGFDIKHIFDYAHEEKARLFLSSRKRLSIAEFEEIKNILNMLSPTEDRLSYEDVHDFMGIIVYCIRYNGNFYYQWTGIPQRPETATDQNVNRIVKILLDKT